MNTECMPLTTAERWTPDEQTNIRQNPYLIHGRLALLKEPAQQTPGDIIHNPPTQRSIRIGRGLTEAVTAREGQGVGNSQNKGDHCTISVQDHGLDIPGGKLTN